MRKLASRRLRGPRLHFDFSIPWEIRRDGTWFALHEQQVYTVYKIFFFSLVWWFPESETDRDYSLHRTREEEALIISGNDQREAQRLLDEDRQRTYVGWGFKT